MTTCGICLRDDIPHEDCRIVFDPFCEPHAFEICQDCLHTSSAAMKMVAINDDRIPGHAVYVYTEKE